MIHREYIILVIGMGLVTYLPRWMPLFFLSRRELPAWFVEWLDLIPAAILSALLLPELITTGEPRHMELWQPELLVAVPTFIFALKTKSLGGTVVVGMLLFWLTGKVI
ncbi:MAG: AzlD domain-containing protein [Candidatus Desulfatibia sp.]|uniref:AzlD domain-containing protein n=1 Tax=Candidatus Desulfatibia sp. TaxID=3101189 RepID=UPI002F2EEDA5